MKLKNWIFMLVMTLSFALGAAAAEIPSFDELDRDRDGYISQTEAQALPCLGANFHKLETASENGLNRHEYVEAVEQFCAY